MKKNKLTAAIAWTLIASMCLTACTENADKKRKKHDDDDDETQPVIKIEVDGTEPSETAIPVEETLPAETEAIQPIEQPVSYDYEAAYIEVINNFSNYAQYTNDSNERSFDLIYFDDDTIPELVVEDGICMVYMFTYADGEIHTIMNGWVYGAGGNHGYSYSPYKGIVSNDNADYAGAYFTNWYGVLNENYELVDDGTSRHCAAFPDGTADPWDYLGKLDENSDHPWYYYVNDVEVTQEEYEAACYPDYEFEFIGGNYSYDEITFFLSNEVVPANDSETDYEIFVMDCTWEEAEAYCKSQGGHLATISGSRGWYSLYSLINDDTSEAFAFYIGGTYNEADGKYYWTADGSGLPVGDYIWRSGEPSITGKTEDGRTVNEDKICILVTENNGYKHYEAMDVPNDIIDAAASYKGKVGFICEYD